MGKGPGRCSVDLLLNFLLNFAGMPVTIGPYPRQYPTLLIPLACHRQEPPLGPPLALKEHLILPLCSRSLGQNKDYYHPRSPFSTCGSGLLLRSEQQFLGDGRHEPATEHKTSCRGDLCRFPLRFALAFSWMLPTLDISLKCLTSCYKLYSLKAALCRFLLASPRTC